MTSFPVSIAFIQPYRQTDGQTNKDPTAAIPRLELYASHGKRRRHAGDLVRNGEKLL